jgi:hypothetical protein
VVSALAIWFTLVFASPKLVSINIFLFKKMDSSEKMRFGNKRYRIINIKR